MPDTFTPPTVEDFLARYPEFSSLAEGEGEEPGIIDIVLAETILDVTDRWKIEYRAAGMMALTAHILVTGGALKGETTGIGGLAGIASVSVGDTSVSFKTASGSGSDAAYSMTSYGQRFVQLRRLALPNAIRLMRA